MKVLLAILPVFGSLCLVPALPALAAGKQAPQVAATQAAIYCGNPTEPPPAGLFSALSAEHVAVLQGGALSAAGQALGTAKRAIAELRCTEALPILDQAEQRLLQEVPVEDARALLAQVESLTLVCADRLGDEARAGRASDRLMMTRVEVPADVALVLRRYRPGAIFGPPPPPSRVETDPPGAQVIRNLLKVGTSPTDVPGGNPGVDLLDVEQPGWRKVHRALGSGEKIALGLRTEDRLPVLVDEVSTRPLGKSEQAAALLRLYASGQAQSYQRVVLFAPEQKGGQAVAGERLVATVYDLRQKKWLTPVVDINAGPPQQQAGQLVALLAGTLPSGKVAGQTAKTAPKRTASTQQEPVQSGFKLPFSKTKWYSWVIAGGVAALIVGLLVAQRFGSDSVTIHATH